MSYYEYVGLLLLHVMHWMQVSILLYNFGTLGILPWNEEE